MYFAYKPFTIQMMVRPDDSQTGSTPTILDLGSKLQLTLGAADANGKGYPLTLKSASASAPTGIYLKPNAFTSLTLAVDAAGAATVTAVNAEDSVTVVPLADKLSAKVQFANSDNTGLCLGGSYQSSANHAFSGYIDEMRVFSGKALSREEILANYNHTLCGTEDGLIAYWPVDEGFSGQTTAYDYSKTSGVANGNHARLGAGTSPTGSVIPTSHQLGLFGLTDAQGNFVIRGVPFTGDGTNYMVIPSMGIHEYSPTYSTRYVSASSLVHSGVDFTDVSSFPVSGTVFYEGTDYPVEGCTFYVDGTICSRDGELIQSAEDGTFTISVPIGDHFIQVKKDGHVFASAGRYPADPNGAGVKITFDREIKNMEFINQTLVNFTGRVVGGSIEGEKPVGFGASQNNIGITELVLSPTNDRYRLNVVKKTNGTSYSYETNTSKAAVESATSVIASHSWRGAGDAAKKIFIRTDSLTGEFSAMVPPLMYNVESMKVVATGLSVGDATTVDATYPLVQLTDTLVTENGVRQEYAYNCKLNQTYHSAPSFTVTQRGHDDGAFGLSEYEIEDANGKLTIDDLNISFNQFDRDYHNLKAFRIQYRKQGDTDWTLIHEYVINEADKTQNNELLPSTATVSYKLPMHNFSDGNYTFRILSVSTYGNEEVYNTSEEIALVKDMQRPQPLGMPTPTNGILSPGDDVSIEFNENFLKGELTKTANFIVTGVLNGAEVSHATALGMTGTDNTAATEADINLAGKSFAIDAWVNLNGAGTLLTHGKGEQKLVVGMDDNRHLQVKIDNNVYTSKTEMPTDKWAYLTINYAANANGCTLKAAVAEDATTTDLFTDEAVAAYYGNGPLAIGQHLTGAIHELTLWDEAHDMTAALMEKNKTKNPATRHLIGYWKMDEGEGTVITDYARNRHLRMTGENWYLNNENKAITLDGTSHLDIPTADVSPLAADNCAIELWMRADKQKGETQLLQAGEVELWMNTDGVLQLTSGNNTFAAGTASLQDKAWHHVALNILRNGNAAVYVDGERTMATSATGIGTTGSDRMIIGARRTLNEDGTYEYDRQLVGNIDEIRLWNATLSADILKSRRKMRLNGTEQGLVAYYPFEKKTLDAYNQVVTEGTDDDMLRTDHKAVYADALTFTDEAPALREKKTETNVDYSFTASDNKIVITLNETPASIAACTLNFTVRDLRDVNGNLSLPVCWSAYINNNELAWSENSMKMTKKTGESHTFEASFANKSGKQQMWTISGMPSWLKADAEYGTVDPLATETISFEVTEATPVGKYEETIYLTGNDGIATPLTLSLTVEGDKPDWTVDKGKYESTMSIIGTLSILGKPSYDADDIVGVFVDDECRGIAHPAYNARYDNSFLLLDVYGNDSDAGKALTFKAYDASTGIMYPVTTTSQDVTFSANVLIGKYADPLLIEAADKMEQTTLLSTGWNWTSFYAKADDMNVSSVFASVADGVETVKSKDAFANCDKGTWHGKSFDVDNRSMYKARMSSAKVLKLIGSHGSKEDRTITVMPGCNWIAYNNTQTASVADALAGMDPQDGDMIKGQYGFALFDGYEWTGSLKALTPGQGYMLQSASANVRTFNYPSSLPAYVQKKAAAQSKQSTFTPVDHHKYPSNMTITARVTLDGMVQQDAEVGVFAGDECRTAEFTDADGYAYFTVPGDGKCTLRFMLAKDGQTWLSDVTLDFAEDAICGSYKLPFEVTFGKTTFIDGITADDDTNTRWYDLNGMLLNGKPSVSGVYMRSTYDANTGMTVTRKVVLK